MKQNLHPQLVCVLALSVLAIAAGCTKATPTPSVPAQATRTSIVVDRATPTPLLTQPPQNTPVAPTPTPLSVITAAARVNNQPIPLADYEAQVLLAISALGQQQSFDPNTEEGRAALLQLQHQILESMIDQTLIEQGAAREGIVVPMERAEEEMARLIGDDTAKFDDWLKENGLTREAFKSQLQRQLLSASFQEHIVGATAPVVEQVHARHILLQTESDAMDLLIKLQEGQSFASLAAQYSLDRGSKDQGGDLGFFPRGVMTKQLEAVAFGLNPGQISGIVQTDFGYHIIEVVEKDPARRVADELLAPWRQTTFVNWLESQRTTAKIEYLISLQ
jgi:hypothetical protein